MDRTSVQHPDGRAGRTGTAPPRTAPAVPPRVSGRLAAVRRRWPWAVGAALAGSLVGAGTAYVLSRLRPPDSPDAQEPEELQAVVDRSRPIPPEDDGPASAPAP